MRGNPDYLTSFARTIRKNPTYSEKMMWRALRNRKQLGLKFRREHPVSGYIADFFCFEHKLIVEIDGDVHLEEKKKNNDNHESYRYAAQAYQRACDFHNPDFQKEKVIHASTVVKIKKS